MDRISERNEVIIIGVSLFSLLPSILFLRMSSMQCLRYLQLLSIITMAYVFLIYFIYFQIQIQFIIMIKYIVRFTLITFIVLRIVAHEELAHHTLEQLGVPNVDSPASDSDSWATNFGGFSVSMGIFLFCFPSTSNALTQLPLVQGSMRQPARFGTVLRRSFLLLFAMNLIVGVCGMLHFAFCIFNQYILLQM